ncbi:dephospho-CoA kinase [Synechococcus sp. HB1133]|uniref:dephospho-CoA kinase n=1 Tax=unclassified Synechococcus TaxID=2626047 RepID=UPI0014078F13|nr:MULTISPECIES: dephospho-CoA kinase [unclassified Synechococcus]MCB4394002.1 dephospho-CoA kinase [Synechococcus sp. PH41509]MCB4421737.1 dephospho-CoA kinase [Synechococcus sp. HB1133]MCB4430910.1 dephospho-CoA kinase [Synechococcus sp. HBA1120]NHI80679.1 dephospho-CoA kinase [Synechococcus sp. HB1133]
MAPGELFSQRRIGLTGGIASGKSSVGRWLAQQGLPVLDADQFAREALAPGRQATHSVLQRYGSKVQGEGAATIDRAVLGRIVFQDPAERLWLEQLIHPIVRDRFDQALTRHAETPAIVLMIPLLFEAGLESLCSEIWLVDCDESQQLQRLIARDGLSPAAAQARIAAQWPLSRKRALADHVISNQGQPGAWHAQAVTLLNATAETDLGC